MHFAPPAKRHREARVGSEFFDEFNLLVNIDDARMKLNPEVVWRDVRKTRCNRKGFVDSVFVGGKWNVGDIVLIN